MFPSLILVSSSLRPVIFIPPLFGTVLNVIADDLPTYWYCPRNLAETQMWVNEEYLIPPLLNCGADYLASEWINGTVTNRTNVQVVPPDFGGIAAINWLDTGIFGYHIIPDFAFILDDFVNHGYVTYSDLFGAPYDWRHTPLYIEHFYVKLQELIENASALNNGQPVALFTYSAGGLTTYHFLTQKVTQEWKDRYIDRVIWGSPSFGGSMSATEIAFAQKITFIPDEIMSDSLFRFFTQSPVLFAHFPNWNITPDQVLLQGPDGDEYRAKDVAQFLADRGRLTPNGQAEANEAKSVWRTQLEFPGVNSYFLFNAGYPTLQTLKWESSYDEPYERIMGSGDGTLLKETLYWPCKNWNGTATGKAVVCHDFNEDLWDWSHILMLAQPEFIETVWNVTTEDNWTKKGNQIIVGKRGKLKK